ncbi:MAG TPA: phosphate signaling complex protein PhoU [Pseudomonadales bacterium]|jgi:phosphate transport system protein|nr:phosphate signaling complex protein PhoU [Cellvibrionales bacterium]OPZ70825.1 MAG: Phosphate-specific transport system accessory protein PhoU [bacterium ADurb.Bin478]HRG50229.1 phosphate signaling complex protein PhoU [Pseudomonadales bacterium]
MNDNQHLSSQYNEELAQLRTQVLQMGGLVETQVSAAMDAYISSQSSQLADIVAADQKINSLEKNIDDNCAHIIAKRQPTASDLRLVLGIIKIVTDLERMGDEAKKIAKGTRRIHDAGQIPVQHSVGIHHLAEAALNLVRQALDAFARLDATQAQVVIRADNEVDAEFKSILRQLITHMMEDPRTITVAIEIIAIARAIERIGDHAKNIVEQVVFVVEGRDIRHLEESAL